MKSICFFNCFHNGDVFNSKAFVTEIMQNIDTKYYYAHNNNQKIIADLPLQQLQLNEIQGFDHCASRFVITDDVVYVNTWIGAYFEPDGECTLRFSYNMYRKIYESLNEMFGSNLTLDADMTKYFPSIDFSKFDFSFIKKKMQSLNPNYKKVLVANGPGHSGQCAYNGNFADVILEFIQRHNNAIFFVTDKIPYGGAILQSTDNVTNRVDCDLNEISYMSQFCDVIVGRSSGPYSFSCTYENMNDSNKKFFCFGDKITDCFQYGVETKSQFFFHKFENRELLVSDLEKVIYD